MPTRHVFTYGSLMFEPVWRKIVGQAYTSEPAHVYGFHRRRIKGDSYPVLVPAFSGNPIAGILYRDLTAADLARLDRFEGEYYRRRQIQVHTNQGPDIAQAYVLKPRYRHLASREDWRPQSFQREMDRFLHRYCQPGKPK